MGVVAKARPHDLDAERHILGALMVDADALTGVNGLTPEAFYKPAHAHVFEAIRALHAKGSPVDAVMVNAELQRAGLGDHVGGVPGLVEIASTAADPSKIGHYAGMVEEHAEARLLLAAVEPARAGDAQAARRALSDVLERSTGAGNVLSASLLDTHQVCQLPPPDYLIQDFLVRDSLALLYGPSGQNKTFLAVDWSLHVATGCTWNGYQVAPTSVLYVIAEGVSGVGARVNAWAVHHRTHLADTSVLWLARSVNLLDGIEADALVGICRQHRPGLVVIDTLARCMVGAEENSARDMGQVVANLDRIRLASGACVLAVHHSGKDLANGARGNSALRGALQTELETTSIEHRMVLKTTKQKDGPEAPPMRLDRIAVPGTDSCALVPAGHVVDDGSLGRGAAATLEALASIEVPGGIATSVWAKACEASERTFYNHRRRLLDLGLIRNVGTDRQPRYVTVPDVEEAA